MINKRTITLKVTKTRLTEEQVKELPVRIQTEPGGGDCGGWFAEIDPVTNEYYTCRICYSGAPTFWPYKECVGPYPL